MYSSEYQRVLEEHEGFSEEEVYCFLDHCRPAWALAINKTGALEAGTQLLTRDGRITGNARILNQDGHHWFKIKTDAGNEMMLMDEEIHKLFHIGIYFIDEYYRNHKTD